VVNGEYAAATFSFIRRNETEKLKRKKRMYIEISPCEMRRIGRAD
jgi:hypothetical protein